MLIFAGVAFAGGISILIVAAAIRIILSLFLPKSTMAAIDAGTKATMKVIVKLYIVAMAGLILWIIYIVVRGGN